jgi:phage-related minor tail protein
VSDVIGSASVIVTPDLSSFASDLAAALGPIIAQVGADLSAQIGAAASSSGDEIRDRIGGGIISVGDIAKGVAIGELIADGIKAGVAVGLEALQSIATFLPNLGGEIQSQFNQIRTSTGETGPVLDSLKQSFDNIAKSTPAGLDQVGQAVSVLNQRLDLTGPNLENTSQAVIRLARTTGTDLGTNLQNLSGAFNNFNVAADAQAGKVDELFRIYQKTGVPVTDLESSLSKLGATARLSGLSFEDTGAMIGQLSKAGLDASTVQRAFTKILKDSADRGVDAKVGFQQTFDAIRNGTFTLQQGMDLFGPRAAQVFELIKEGKLDYQGLSAEISRGGDTLAQAASDTSTWQAQLGILTNQLKIDLEPVATFVFARMTDVVKAFRPVIEGIANFVIQKLVPGFGALVVALAPVWDFFNRVRLGVQDAMNAIAAGGSILDGFGSLLTTVFGEDVSQHIVDGINAVAQAFVDLWNASEPLRTAIANTFTTVRDAIGGFIGDHPDVALVGLAGALTAVVVPAVLALAAAVGTALVGAIGSLLSILASPVVIVGALAAAFYYLYTQVQPVHDAIDAIGRFLRDVFMAGLTALQSLWNTVWPVIVDTAQTAANVFNTSIRPALEGLFQSLQPLIQWAIDHWQILAVVFGAVVAPIPTLIGLFVALYEKSETFRNIVNGIIEGLKPFLEILINLAGNVIGDVINAVSGLIDILTGLFSWDWDKVRAGLVKVAEAILGVIGHIGEAVWGIIQNLGPLILRGLEALGSLIWQGLQAAFHYVVDNWQTILIDLTTLITAVPRQILSWLGDLGSLVFGWLKAAWQYVVDHAPEWMDTINTFIGSLPGRFISALGSGLSFLLTFMYNAVQWLIQNAPQILDAINGFLGKIPGWIWDALTGLGSILFDAVKAGFQFVVDKGPDVLAAIIDWVKGIPGKLVEAGLSIGSTLFDWLKSAFQFVVDKGPDLLFSVLDWFKGLPGKIFDAIKEGLNTIGGAAADIGKTIFNAIAGFLNDKLINPIRGFAVDIGPYHATPFEGLPTIPQLAEGGIVDRATLAIIGEAGAEAVVPLNSTRAAQMANDSGLAQLGARPGTVIGPITIQVNAGSGMSHSDAYAAGRAAGAGFSDEVAIKTAIRVSPTAARP